MGLYFEAKDSYREQLTHLLDEPNSGFIFNKKEVKKSEERNAFTYTTRNSNPTTYNVDVEQWESDAGTRYIAFSDGDIVSAAMVKDNVVVGLITDIGYENVGIGTNLLNYIKSRNSNIKFDTLRSNQGERLVRRVKESNMSMKYILQTIIYENIKCLTK